jgi:hypothetical protein
VCATALAAVAGLGAVATASAHGGGPDAGHHGRGHGELRRDLRAARAGTAAFHSLDRAKAAGYGLLVDAAGIACIDMPGEGGMGVHYVNSALVGDDRLDAGTPELVVYEPGRNGRMRLVAAEYVVFQDAWDAHHTEAPELFGREFELVQAGNRYGLPPFYELHAWIWKHNPSGMFADWNPRVSCPA